MMDGEGDVCWEDARFLKTTSSISRDAQFGSLSEKFGHVRFGAIAILVVNIIYDFMLALTLAINFT